MRRNVLEFIFWGYVWSPSPLPPLPFLNLTAFHFRCCWWCYWCATEGGRSLSVCRGCCLACRQRGPISRLAAAPALGRGGAWRGGPGRAGPPGSPRALSAAPGAEAAAGAAGAGRGSRPLGRGWKLRVPPRLALPRCPWVGSARVCTRVGVFLCLCRGKVVKRK